MSLHINSQIAGAIRIATSAIGLFRSKRACVAFFKERGWTRIGSGAFGVVFTHSLHPRVVVKVSARLTERTTRPVDDGFQEYANAIIRGWIRSSFAPRVYFTERLRGNDRVTVTVMERCLPCRNEEFVHRAERTAMNLEAWRIYDGYELGGHARRFLEILRQYGKLDIHKGNVMQRANGSMVFTDPLVLDRR
ncbi:hypothetical protein HJA82_29625 [Rhizobium bangladeshense]|uniref:hypothetical protein n=1 Tax=Rhizobium bangladeshense TaxID=1138189 RepID=UPI001C831A39|nr:hypothetical protein [Rhizobium bangladeshense]MBX4911477.1 hypothetical protein [Rhizobium bangladeshense]